MTIYPDIKVIKRKSGSVLSETPTETGNLAKTTQLVLRLIRAGQPISRVELAHRIGVNRSTITEICNPLLAANLLSEVPISTTNVSRPQGRPRIGLTLTKTNALFVGASIGVCRTQVGIATLNNKILDETDFETPKDPVQALALIKEKIEQFCAKFSSQELKIIGVSVPGVTDSDRRKLIYAPHLDWKDVEIAKAFK